jgi:hypothetical protein
MEEHYRGGLGFPDLSIAYFVAFSGIVLCIGVLLFENLILILPNRMGREDVSFYP